MRIVLAAAVAVAVVTLTGCPDPAVGVCGLSNALPGDDEVGEGRGRASRSDGGELDATGSWSPGGDITIGTLSFTGNTDEDGLKVDDLIAAATFPICQRLGARDDRTAAANLVAEGLVTDATHVGALAILGRGGKVLIGRFEVELTNPAGTTTVTLSDGAFRLPQR